MEVATACACGTCPSCTGVAPRPPVVDPIVYRHSAIKARMLGRIASSMVGKERPLANLRTRDDADPAVALIDAFAGSLHILAYSAARLSDDGSILRTQDRDALVNLTRMLGYEPRPALSASTTVAFKVNALAGGPTTAMVPMGTRIASVPGQNERPQSFETETELDARAEWNAIRPAVEMRPFRVRSASKCLRIEGTGTTAKVGDLVLAYMTEQPMIGTCWLVGRIAAIERVPDNIAPALPEARAFVDRAAPAFTRLRLRSTGVLKTSSIADDLTARNKVIVLAQRAGAFGNNAPNAKLIDAQLKDEGSKVGDAATGDWKNLQMLVTDAGEPVTVEQAFHEIVYDQMGAPSPDAAQTITQAAAAFKDDKPVKIILAGHSDRQDTAAANLTYSERLARKVADALVAKGVPSSAIEAKAFGDTQPASPSPGGSSRNTRVEIIFVEEVSDGVIDLDAVHPDAMEGRVVLFESDRSEGDQQIGLIRRVAERSRTDFGLSAKVSRVWLTGIDLSDDTGFNKRVRETSIFLETGREVLIQAVKDRVVPRKPYDRLRVQGKIDLPVGRRIAVTGELCESAKGEMAGEIATIAEVTIETDGNSLLRFEQALNLRFRSITVAILGNSVQATHGETVGLEPEILGSTDSRQLAPRYRLKASPLSYVPAVNPKGYEPALKVQVSDRICDEVPTLWGLETTAHAYTVHTVEEATSELQFAGRLPTGFNNVRAAYRKGSGTAGNLAAGRLTTIMTPVLGVTTATNPVATEGGSDAETIEEMRTSAPQSIRTLDRVVSLSDFEVFARRFRGVGKALATELQAGMRKIVFLSIATTDLKPPVSGSDLVKQLKTALAEVAVPGRVFRIAGFVDLAAEIGIAFAADPAILRSDVENSVRRALADRFSRARRQFGQPLTRSEILAAVQNVDGVVAARISAFAVAGGAQETGEQLLSPAPEMKAGGVTLAGLLWVDRDKLTFEEMRA